MTAELPSGVLNALDIFSGTLHESDPDDFEVPAIVPTSASYLSAEFWQEYEISQRARVSCKPAESTRQHPKGVRVQCGDQLDTSAPTAPRPARPSGRALAGGGTGGLSMCHNAASLKAWVGGGLVELKAFGGQVPQREAVPRGRIIEFSSKSRRNLMRLVSGKLKVTELPKFVTLTYPDEFPKSIREQRRDVENWWARVERLCPEASSVWKREWKQRQSGENAGKVAPHFHLLCWGISDEVEMPAVRGVTLQRKFAMAEMGWWDEWRKIGRAVYVEGEEPDIAEMCWGGVARGAGEVKVYEFEKYPLKGRHKGKKVRVVERYERVSHRDWQEQTRGNDRKWTEEKFSVPFKTWCSVAWAEVVGSDDPRHVVAGTSVENVRSREGVAFYASKYICKVDEEEAVEQSGGTIGRSWGIFNREKLPWAEVVELELSEDQRRRLLRISRRYVESKVRAKGKAWRLRPGNRSHTWFCTAPEYWAGRLAPTLGIGAIAVPSRGASTVGVLAPSRTSASVN